MSTANAERLTSASHWKSRQITVSAIAILPDDVLLEMFSFYLAVVPRTETWHTLVHVCRRWRSIVFASPRRLDLRLVCTVRTRVKEMLDIWPILPIEIWATGDYATAVSQGKGEDNIAATLEHKDRVYEITVESFSSAVLERIGTAMQEPFPALTDIRIASLNKTAGPVFPQEFLGGSAQHLRSCFLYGIAIPGIRQLLLSATNLVELHLWKIPHSTYVSPEALATCLSTMPSLKRLWLRFQSPQSRPNRHLPPRTRVVLPALTRFWFKGVSEYLEDLVSRIGIPLLQNVDITLFNQLIFNIPRLHDFLARAEAFKAHSRAVLTFHRDTIGFDLESRVSLQISCTNSDWQISSMAQVCSSFMPPFSTLERLDIREGSTSPRRWQDVEITQWLELLHPFTALRDLYLDKKVAPRVVLAIRGLVEDNETEDLRTLQNLFIEDLKPSGPLQEAIGEFVAACQHSGFPLAVHSWDEQS